MMKGTGRAEATLCPAVHRRAVPMFLCTAALCILTSEVAFADGLDSYRLATGYYQRKKWELSAQEFRTFLKDLPDHPKAEKAEVFLGMALVNHKDFKAAREVFRGCIASHQASPNIRHR